MNEKSTIGEAKLEESEQNKQNPIKPMKRPVLVRTYAEPLYSPNITEDDPWPLGQDMRCAKDANGEIYWYEHKPKEETIQAVNHT
tara:strand:+ start:4009 stop:4263 length:255 start_codon:yes stop_codon:yes gene_type:complete